MALVPIPVTNEQAKAVQKLADFGTTVVGETGQLARYIGRVLGTAPEDAVGLTIGDPLHTIRTATALKYDEWITRLHRNRGVTPEPVSPSLAMPLLRAAYDETRPPLQELWAHLIAAAMDPQRANRVRRSFIDTVQRLDPLDALVLKRLGEMPDNVSFVANLKPTQFNVSPDEWEISTSNLCDLRCLTTRPTGTGDTLSRLTSYGRELVRACSD
jgi:hypothetical protein